MILLNSCEGGTDDVEITEANSGGASGDAWDTMSDGGVAPVYEATDPAAGAMCARLSTSVYALWSWLDTGPDTEAWARFYFKIDDPTPAANITLLRFKDSSGSNNMDFRLLTSGAFQLRERGLTARYTSTYTAQANTWVRCEVHVVADGTNGHMEARLFYGGNLHGDTPDETFGNLVDNWNTLTDIDQCQFSITAPGQTVNAYYDEFGFSDEGWVGSAVAGQLDTPTNFAFVKTSQERELTASWDSVTGADHYEIEVEYWDGDSWEPFYSDANVSASPVVIDDTDGVGWNTLYRARVRAVPSA